MESDERESAVRRNSPRRIWGLRRRRGEPGEERTEDESIAFSDWSLQILIKKSPFPSGPCFNLSSPLESLLQPFFVFVRKLFAKTDNSTILVNAIVNGKIRKDYGLYAFLIITGLADMDSSINMSINLTILHHDRYNYVLCWSSTNKIKHICLTLN